MKVNPNIVLKDLIFLNQQSCKIKNPQKLQEALNQMAKDGPKKLQVISDFDHTITKQRTPNGSPCATSFHIFNDCKSLPESFKDESKKLFNIYYPIEIDPSIPYNEKIKHMTEWWTRKNNILSGFPFDQKELDIEAEKCKDHLRDRSKEFFEILENFEVPVLVFSAGLGNSVESVLRQAGVLNKNVKIVSNFLRFKDNLVDGFQPPLIHNLNKNETVLSGSDFHSLVENRNNIILLGDSLGDADMSNGAPDSSNIIKIGFLFHHVKDNLEKYMDTFDIVLIDDQSMNVPLEILHLIKN